MRIIYFANSRIPTHKAHGLEIFKLCEALQKYNDVILVLPKRFNHIKDDPFDYYKIKRKFSIIKIPVVDTIFFAFLGKFGFWIESVSFAFFVFFYVLFKTDNSDIFISHDNAPILVASFLRKKTFYDIHDFPVRGLFFYSILMRRCLGIITTNNWKKDELISNFNVPKEKILVYPNGVEIDDFDITTSREEAREKLGLATDKKIILYVGSFIYWKGVETLVKASDFIKSDVQIYLVGGTISELAKLGIKIFDNKKITVVGNRPHEEVALWLRSADLLVLPTTAKYNISKYYTSPMKLFEYMASGKPIIASDVISVRSVADDSMVYFFAADDIHDLALSIENIINDYSNAVLKAKNARAEVNKYTWDERAKKITEFYAKK